jgi:transcriptional regulator with XRE-family HTH domain
MVKLRDCATDAFLNYKLRQAREEMGISLREASKRLGIEAGTLEAYERLRCSPGDQPLGKLAEFYSLHPEEITPDPNLVREIRRFRRGYDPGPLREDLLPFEELDGNSREELRDSEDAEDKKMQLNLLKKALTTLDPRDRELVELKYGLNGKEKLGFEEAGRKAYGKGLTKQAVFHRMSNIHVKLSILMNLIKEWHLD